MINVINDKRTAREVVRVSVRSDKGPEAPASFILKSMILDDKEVYLKYIIENNDIRPQRPGETDEEYEYVKGKLSNRTTKELTYKMHKILNFMQRMLTDSLETICGGYDKVPEKYRGKKLTILCGLPYRKDTIVSQVEREGDTFVKKEEAGGVVKRAMVMKLYLAYVE